MAHFINFMFYVKHESHLKILMDGHLPSVECPLYQWTIWTLSMDSLEFAPWNQWTLSMETVDSLDYVHGLSGQSPGSSGQTGQCLKFVSNLVANTFVHVQCMR